jgi:Na+/H+ antiporter NhaD/arsenite permease-like protein
MGSQDVLAIAIFSLVYITLVGSVANLIVARGAKDECPLSSWSFLRVGALSTMLTVLASVLMLWVYGRIGWA